MPHAASKRPEWPSPLEAAWTAAEPLTCLDALQTPALVLDRGIMERNIARFEAVASRAGVKLRPHGKTAKAAEIYARLARPDGRLTTSTFAETQLAVDARVPDIFYAIAMDARKVSRFAPLVRDGAAISFLTDLPEAAAACASEAEREQIVLPFWIEIDVDHYRAGADPESAAFVELAALLSRHPSVSLKGLMSYAGASYGADSPEAMADIAERHRAALTAAAARLRSHGIDPGELSLGSGPAALFARNLDGINEVRAGIHIFQDLFQAGIGACRVQDVALSVLATVIGVRRDLNRVIIDAGGLALSKDRSTAGRSFDAGYGLVADRDGVIDDVFVQTVSQELGVLGTRSGRALPFSRLLPGSRLRILPNHADMTAAAYPHYHVVDGDETVVGLWPRANFW